MEINRTCQDALDKKPRFKTSGSRRRPHCP